MTKKTDQGDYSCLKGKEGKEYAAECTFEELLEATGAANQQLLEKALERNNIHHIKGYSGVKARSSAPSRLSPRRSAHSSRACRRRLRARRSSPSARGRRCRRGAEEERDGRARRRERTAERNLNKSARPAAPRPAVMQYTYTQEPPESQRSRVAVQLRREEPGGCALSSAEHWPPCARVSPASGRSPAAAGQQATGSDCF